MTVPNAWHHSERVYLQATDGDMVLVQYVERQPVSTKFYDRENEYVYAIRKPVVPWAWLPRSEVTTDADVRELDRAVMAIWNAT